MYLYTHIHLHVTVHVGRLVFLEGCWCSERFFSSIFYPLLKRVVTNGVVFLEEEIHHGPAPPEGRGGGVSAPGESILYPHIVTFSCKWVEEVERVKEVERVEGVKGVFARTGEGTSTSNFP